MKLAQRLSLTHGFIALLAVVVTVGVMIGGARLILLNEVRESQQRQLAAFALTAREAYFAHEDVEVLNFIKLAVKDELVAYTAYVSSTGQKLVLPPAFTNDDPAPGDRNLSNGRLAHVMSAPILADNQKVATVAIAYDAQKTDARIDEQVDRWVELGLVAGLSALAVAILISIIVSQELSRPLKRIKEGTDEVRSGKLDKLVDVTRSDEIGDLARAFNTMVVQLKELDAMKRDFVAGVTHDFGTPLHALKNAIEILQEGRPGPVTAKQAEYLMILSNNTIQLTSFINNLLTTASIEAAKVEPYYELFDATALAREVVDLFQPLAENKGLLLKLESPNPSLSLVSDVIMMRQILTNLVSNAMKYTVTGGAVVSLDQVGDVFELKVIDTGVGIDPKYHELIFDKFFRVKQPKNLQAQQGAGLGLSIVKGLVEVLKGSISLDSRPEGGSVFTVRLPRHSLEPDLKEPQA